MGVAAVVGTSIPVVYPSYCTFRKRNATPDVFTPVLHKCECVWGSRITDGLHPVKHSEVAALPAGVTGQVVRAWARDFVNGNRFKVRVRDYATRSLLSLIHDEDFREESREWLDAKIYGRKDGEPQLRVRDFQKCVWNVQVVAVVSI